MFFRKKKNPLDDKLNELQMNLENNYKDLAIAARKEAESLYARMMEEGKFKKKKQWHTESVWMTTPSVWSIMIIRIYLFS